MVFKKQVLLSTILLCAQTQITQSQYISANYFHTSTLQVLGFFATSAAIAKLLCPDLGRQNSIEGKHNPDHDTLDGGTLYYAKWGAALGALSRFLICPNQLKKIVTPCHCSLDTSLMSGLVWTCAGAALGGTFGYLRAASLDEKHSLECAEALLKLIPEEQRLANLVQELAMAQNANEKEKVYKKVATIHPASDYPLVYSHQDFKSMRTRFLKIETYLKRALKNEELDHHEIALIGDLMQHTKKILYAVEDMLIFISNHQEFTNQLVAQTEVFAIQNTDN